MIADPTSERIAGVDEAGRGPLAGPVVVAAVMLRPGQVIPGLDDSKALSARRREQLQARIQSESLAWSVVRVAVEEIDRINILQATLRGMARALAGLAPAPTWALVDGNRLPAGLPCPATAVIGGDAIEPAIMAASILAKVHRDRLMLELHEAYPDYGFDRHKGYPSPLHLQALERFGPCPEHRTSFAPVRRLLDPLTRRQAADPAP